MKDIKLGMFCIPQPGPGHMHMEIFLEFLFFHPCKNLALTVHDPRADRAIVRHFRFHLYSGMFLIVSLYKDIFKMNLFPDIQIDRPVNSSICKVVDHISKRRNIQALPAVQSHHDPVDSAIFQKGRQVCFERSISAAMNTYTLPIAVQLCLMCGSFHNQDNRFSRPFRRNIQFLYIAADHLILFLI